MHCKTTVFTSICVNVSVLIRNAAAFSAWEEPKKINKLSISGIEVHLSKYYSLSKCSFKEGQ